MLNTTLFRKNSPIIILLSIFVILSQAGSVSAGDEIWKSLGPEGVKIHSLAINPSTPTLLYAGTDGGVIKSTNGGKDWNLVGSGGSGLPNANVWRVALDPKTPTTLYAVTQGVFKSIDSGQNWSQLTNGLGSLDNDIAIDPATPTTLYVGTWEGAYKSINGGESWYDISIGLAYPSIGHPGGHAYIRTLAIDPQTPATLYAGSFDGGVFKTTNGGESWSAVNNGLTEYYDLIVDALAVNPGSPATLYAGTMGGVFKSTNHGENWTAINNGLPVDTDVLTLAIDPLVPTTLYLGSHDSGAFKSIDGGDNWIAFNNGLTDTMIKTLVFNHATPSTLYVGTGGSGAFALRDFAIKIYLPLVVR